VTQGAGVSLHTRRSFLGTSLAAASAALTGARAAEKSAALRAATAAAATDDLAEPLVFITSEHARYAKVREIYNGAILTKPKMIASCSSEAGILQAVR
jgi:anaerobic selenocysteine-containing dehydrogenase